MHVKLGKRIWCCSATLGNFFMSHFIIFFTLPSSCHPKVSQKLSQCVVKLIAGAFVLFSYNNCAIILSSPRSKPPFPPPAVFRSKLPPSPSKARSPAGSAISPGAAAWNSRRSWRTFSGNRQHGWPWKRSSGKRRQTKTSVPWWNNRLRLSATTRRRCEARWPPELPTRYAVRRAHVWRSTEPKTTGTPPARRRSTLWKKMTWVTLKL